MTNASKKDLVDYLSGIINEQRRELLQNILAQRTRHITVVLEDIYQSQNASAVLRTCECLGIQALHIIENHNEHQINPAIVQGASKWIEINRYKDITKNNTVACLQMLKQRDYKIAATTLKAEATELGDLPIDEKIALCFGSEENGLSDKAIDMADYFVKIPMHGFTQSFNISVSAGISLYHLITRLHNSDIDWHLNEQEKTDLYIDWLVKSTPTGAVLMHKFLQEYKGTFDE
ncbi:MAG: RNA methyltransferase [Gammaproteobacteria bacterium]|nr:RNA methyltransferase [Gammaproteobacteria bacterium]